MGKIEEIIQNEVSLGGSNTMNVTLKVNRDKLCSTKKCVPFLLNTTTKHHRPLDKIVPVASLKKYHQRWM